MKDAAMTVDLESARAQLREQGWCVIPHLLSPAALAEARAALDGAVEQMRARGIATHSETLDPNAANIRVYNLPEWSPVFVDLLRHPVAKALVDGLIGPNNIVSNFTANIALPGSGSMNIHSDQALSVPPPWNEPWVINIIWCLDDVHEGNGATRYVPGSQDYRSFDDVPADIDTRSVPWEAPAGSIIAMEGRMWHTSGCNTSADERRRMMFGYYCKDFIRQQINWEASLSPETKARLDPGARAMLGLGAAGNTRIGGGLTRLRAGDAPDMAAMVTQA
jgi:ectoine hydroxylase-related dioxygenase (phytanoyl-CoA dioxygenase family)